jgi:hypothetical protein
MNDMQRMAAETAMKHMITKGWVDICAIRKILEMTGGIPPREDLQVLELLHCVNFNEMTPELLRGLPLILQRVLGAEALQFEFQEPTRRLMLVK